MGDSANARDGISEKRARNLKDEIKFLNFIRNFALDFIKLIILYYQVWSHSRHHIYIEYRKLATHTIMVSVGAPNLPP